MAERHLKPPKRITVGPHIYKVTHDHAAMSEAVRGDDDLLGRCEPRHLSILIEPDQAASQKRDTVLHECLHALVDLVGLSTEFGHEREEEVVLRLTPALLDLLRRNPALVSYLTEVDG